MPFALSTPSVTTLFPAHGEIIAPSDVTDYSDRPNGDGLDGIYATIAELQRRLT